MKKLVIKDISGMLDDFDESTYITSPYMLVINIDIGIEGQNGADEFRATFCNKEWLYEELYNRHDFDKSFFHNSHLIVVSLISYAEIIKTIENILLSIDTKGSWEEAAMSLNSYFHWEYAREYIHSSGEKKKRHFFRIFN